MIKTKTPGDSIKFYLQKDESYLLSPGTAFHSKIDSSGICTTTFSEIKSVSRISIISRNAHTSFYYYRCLPGDSIVVDIINKNDRQHLNFKGSDSIRYRCQYAMDTAYRNNFERDTLRTNLQSLRRVWKKYEETLNVKRAELIKYKTRLENEVYALFEADIIGKYIESKMIAGMTVYHNNKKNDTIKNQVLTECDLLSNIALEDAQYAAHCDYYIEGIYRKEQARLLVSSEEGAISIKHFYLQLKKRFRSTLLENLVVKLLLSNSGTSNSQEFEYCLNDALEMVQNFDKNEILKQYLKVYSKKSPAYNFSLPNERDERINLTDFSGKVILIDFWFTGCVACKHLASTLNQEIVPRYKDNPSFVMININVDEKKQLWLNSIKSRMYSNPTSQNLFTEGLAFHHPIMKYYRIVALPKLLLIYKDGRIYTGDASRSTETLIMQIDNALKENKDEN